jgi:hypothetical protein
VKIAFCTTCKGRTPHLEQTLRQNLADNADHGDAVFVVVNYNSRDNLESHLRIEYRDEIRSGRLVVYRFTEPTPFQDGAREEPGAPARHERRRRTRLGSCICKTYSGSRRCYPKRPHAYRHHSEDIWAGILICFQSSCFPGVVGFCPTLNSRVALCIWRSAWEVARRRLFC